MVENNGWTLYELNDQEQAKLKKLVEPVYGEWAKKVSKNSKDSSASDALDAFRDAVPNDS
jgi:TRAP-type C4-dicarboxylate transport system substrate-binding protein